MARARGYMNLDPERHLTPIQSTRSVQSFNTAI
jgi:hypothetical protein